MASLLNMSSSALIGAKQGDGHEYVDLGLPSGTLWAIGNLVKDSNGNYAIGEETDYGTYVSWGNIVGHNEGEGYNFNDANYQSTSGYSVGADIQSNDATHDIALATLGSPWHLPTKNDFKELYDNTDAEFVSNYNNTGMAGFKFMKKTEHSIYVFFPASGSYFGSARLGYRGILANYWSSSFYNSTDVYIFYFNNDGLVVVPQDVDKRYNGFSMRPIKSSN